MSEIEKLQEAAQDFKDALSETALFGFIDFLLDKMQRAIDRLQRP